MNYDVKKEFSVGFKYDRYYCESFKEYFEAMNSIYDRFKSFDKHWERFIRIFFLNSFYDDPLYYEDNIIRPLEHLSETRLFKSVTDEVFENIYGRLQGQICRRAIGALRTKRRTKQSGSSLQITEYTVLPHALQSLIDSQRTQQKIRESILTELSILKPICERKLKELQKRLKSYEPSRNSETQDNIWLVELYDHQQYERLQEQTLSYMTLLDKLDYSPDSMIEQIHKRVLTLVNDTALKQFNHWSLTQLEIDQLRESLTSECPPDNSSAIVSKKTHKNYEKIVPKHQFKYF